MIKYGKTMHLPWSPGLQNDDRLITNLDAFKEKRVIVTEKMDGENATLYRDYYHARSLDYRHHPSRDWIKAFHGRIKHDIPEGYRVCGENLYAQHSIIYDDLESYFYGFSFWCNGNGGSYCYDWDTTVEIFDIIGIVPVPVLYDGLWEEFESTHKVFDEHMEQEKNNIEGYVVRVADNFDVSEFSTHVAKYVRKGHVQTDEHWMNKPVIPNKLKV